MSGRAAALRVARRNAWRNRKRTIFLVAIIAIPVALAVVVAGLFRADSSTPEEAARSLMGDADIYVDVSDQPAVLAWLEAELVDISPEAESTFVRSVYDDVAPDVSGVETVSDVDPSDPISGPMRVVAAGRMPDSSGEVALSPRLAERLGVEIDDPVNLTLPGAGSTTLEVVGLVGSPGVYDESLVTVATETMDSLFDVAPESWISLLIVDPAAEATATELAERWHREKNQFWPKSAVLPKPEELETLPDEFYVYLTSDEVAQLVEVARTDGPDAAQQEAYQLFDSTAHRAVEIPYFNVDLRQGFLSGGPGLPESPPAVSTAVSALLLLEVAFIAGAAFAAGTRRRLREIGLLGANGASDKHIRLTVLGEGLAVGGLGALAGIGVGVGVLVLARPLVQRFVSRLLVGVGVTPFDLIGPALMALGAAALAAWIPSRTASRVPTTIALQGRMPAFPPRKWVVPVGFGLAGIGAALMIVALASRAGLATAMVIAGGAMAIGGTALLAGPILAFVSKGADAVTATPRLVLRDSGRHRTRSAVAVAATLVILLIPVVSIAFQATEGTRQRVHGLLDAERYLMLTGVAPEEGMVGGARDITPADAERVAALVPVKSVALFDFLDTPTLIGSEISIADGEVPGISPDEGEGFGVVAVANPELIAALGHPDLATGLAEDGMVVLGVESEPIQVEVGGERRTVSQVPMPTLGFGMPRILVTEEVASGLDGLRVPQALFVLSRPITAAEREALFTGEFDIYGGWSQFTVADLYPLMLGGTLLVVLIVIALVTAVSAAEVDQDLGIVVAVGAPGSIRRRFLGVMAGYQTLVAALLAIPLGLGLLKVVGIAQSGYYAGPFGLVPASFVEVPWPALLAVGIVLPILVAALTALSVRSAPVTPPRRPT